MDIEKKPPPPLAFLCASCHSELMKNQNQKEIFCAHHHVGAILAEPEGLWLIYSPISLDAFEFVITAVKFSKAAMNYQSDKSAQRTETTND